MLAQGSMLAKAGWKRQRSKSGAETWVDPRTSTVHPLVKAVLIETERRKRRSAI